MILPILEEGGIATRSTQSGSATPAADSNATSLDCVSEAQLRRLARDIVIHSPNLAAFLTTGRFGKSGL